MTEYNKSPQIPGVPSSSPERKKIASLETALVELKLKGQALKKTEQYFLDLLHAIDDLIIIVGLDGTFNRFYQDAQRKDLFAHPKQFLGKNMRDVFPRETAEMFQKAMNAVDAYGLTQQFDYSLPLDKKERWFNTRISPFRPASGDFFGYICVIRDITERKQMEMLVREKEERYRAVMQQSSECIILVDIDNRVIVEANHSMQRLLGYSPEDLRGMSLFDLMPEEEEDVYRQTLRILEERGYYKGERKYRRKDGSQVDVEISVNTITYQRKQVYCVIFRDITPRKLAEKQLIYTATHDPLTGLVNRLLFYDRLNQELARSRRQKTLFALLYIDLDKFKEINDTLGHGIGDQLLRAVGVRLQTLIRRKSDTLARMGGDEYTFILTDIANPNDAELIARKIIGLLRDPFDLDRLKHHISASIGIAIYPIDAQNSDDLIKAADIAMYYAKNEGRDLAVRYSPDMRAK